MRRTILLSSLFLGLLATTQGQPLPPTSPPGKPLTPEERKGFEEQSIAIANEANKLYQGQKFPEAEQQYRKLVELHRRLYPDGHPDLFTSLSKLAKVLMDQGKPALAEPLHREALAVNRRLYPEAKFPDGHEDLVIGLNNLATVLRAQRKLPAAESLYREALAMSRRLYPQTKHPDGHPDLATSLNDLADILMSQGKLAAAEPLCHEALAMRRRLYPETKFPDGHSDLANSLHDSAMLLKSQGKPTLAEPLIRQAVEMWRRLYPEAKYPDGHPDLVAGINNLAIVLSTQGKPTAAESHFREVLTFYRRQFPEKDFHDGHPHLVAALNNLAVVLQDQGKPAAAEPLHREALDMIQKLYPEARFPDGYPDLAISLSNLGMVLRFQGKFTEAESFIRQSLAMSRRLYPEAKFPDGHPTLSNSINNLAMILRRQGKLVDAEPLYRESLTMNRRLYPEKEFPDGHPRLATSLNNLATLLWDLGKPAEAEPLNREVLAMNRRLYTETKYPDGHTYVAASLYNLADTLQARKKPEAAEPLYREALSMYWRLTADYALTKTEGAALNFLATVPPILDSYLAATDRPGVEASTVYAAVWDAKAAISRVCERRHIAARATTVSPKTRKLWDEVSGLRQQKADLLLAQATRDPDTRKARNEQLENLSQRIDALQAELREALPVLTRTRDLFSSTPASLQKALSADAAFIDYFHYTRVERPSGNEVKRTDSYVAFVVTSKTVARVELGPAEPIEKNLTLWRKAVEANGDPPADVSRALREQLWPRKLADQLSSDIHTVYLSPVQQLAFLPFAALPGGTPETILLEDYALSVVPSGPFLLDKLSAPKRDNNNFGLVAVGNVQYDKEPNGETPADLLPLRGPAAGEGKPITWVPLRGTQTEVDSICKMARTEKMPVAALTGAEPSIVRLTRELARCRYAHLATHGFFADVSFRRRLQVDPTLFQMSGSERVGPGVLSPFLLSGVVCAGANIRETPGRGLLTAETILNTDLSGLDLAVLSACDTGLGDVGDGEGVLGLQRALHLAGCRNVVASLWKVDDEATVALMRLFYRNLWEKKQPAIEALRQAQLAIYRHPELLPALARGETRAFEKVELPPLPGRQVGTPLKTAPVRQWAAFTLSGTGSKHR